MADLKTFSPKPRDLERRWYVVDADGVVLGRLASEVAKILRGKHKPIFAPHMDTGDHVIVVNAGGVRLTGAKEVGKLYHRHSGYPGGLRSTNYATLLADRPVLAVEKAIRGMLPKNRLGRAMLRKLAVYEGPEHRHQAQKPQPLGVGEIPKWEGLPERTVPSAPAKPKRARAPKPATATGPSSARATRGGAKAAPARSRRASAASSAGGKASGGGARRARSSAASAAGAETKTEEAPKRRRARAKKES